MSPRASRVTHLTGSEANHMFAIKGAMKLTPLRYIVITLTLSIVLFGYQLKVFEGPLSEISNQNFNRLDNAMWNVIITLTTTGYGDIYPKSTLGRFVGLVICFWGTFMVSFFVVTVNNKLTQSINIVKLNAFGISYFSPLSGIMRITLNNWYED
jgi:hypothetical protein